MCLPSPCPSSFHACWLKPAEWTCRGCLWFIKVFHYLSSHVGSATWFMQQKATVKHIHTEYKKCFLALRLKSSPAPGFSVPQAGNLPDNAAYTQSSSSALMLHFPPGPSWSCLPNKLCVAEHGLQNLLLWEANLRRKKAEGPDSPNRDLQILSQRRSIIIKFLKGRGNQSPASTEVPVDHLTITSNPAPLGFLLMLK